MEPQAAYRIYAPMGSNMNPILKQFFTPRVLLSITAGAAAAILLSLFMRKDTLAALLGFLLAISIAGLEKPLEFAILGSIAGSLIGLYLGARNYLVLGRSGSLTDFAGLGISMLAGLLLSGLVCAAYGWIIGKVLELYKQGRGPFF
jgi:hypothetical protein